MHSCSNVLPFADYLLSNNHVNEVICHKFDFSDEEVLAYYISFLKTLSLKLNKHTIHFFYNEVSSLLLFWTSFMFHYIYLQCMFNILLVLVFSTLMILLYTLKQSSSLTTLNQWWELLSGLWPWTFTKVMYCRVYMIDCVHICQTTSLAMLSFYRFCYSP